MIYFINNNNIAYVFLDIKQVFIILSFIIRTAHFQAWFTI